MVRVHSPLPFFRHTQDVYGGCRQAAKTLGCGSSIREFESHHPPQNFISQGYRQAVRHWILIPASGGSNPSTPANFKAT